MGQDIVVTYKTLFELLRLEKTRDELQKLDDSFYEDVAEYLNNKKSGANSSGLSDEERLKNEYQLRNTHKLISEIYSRRERKIVDMALNKARLGSDLIDTSALLKEEKKLFEELVGFFSSYRSDLLLPLLRGKVPELSGKKVEEKKEEPAPGTKPEETEEENKLVRFLHAVPKFVGKELEVYGPFEEDDVANLPLEIADLLIQKGRAEEMSSK